MPVESHDPRAPARHQEAARVHVRLILPRPGPLHDGPRVGAHGRVRVLRQQQRRGRPSLVAAMGGRRHRLPARGDQRVYVVLPACAVEHRRHAPELDHLLRCASCCLDPLG
eukprot:9489129-Pyramimonas_sp.AAC.1